MIARHIVRDSHRVDRFHAVTEVDALGLADAPGNDPEERFLRGERARLVHAAMRALEPDDQRVLRLKLWRGMSCAEIADVLGGTEVTIRKRLSRARRRFATQLARFGGAALIPPAAWLVGVAQHLRRQLAVSAAAPATASALVLAVGTGVVVVGDARVGASEPAAQAPRTIVSSPAFTQATVRGTTPSRDAGWALASSAEKADPTAPAQLPAPGEPPSVVPPLRHGASVSPGTGPGPKESDWLEVPTPLGTVKFGGEAGTTGPPTRPHSSARAARTGSDGHAGAHRDHRCRIDSGGARHAQHRVRIRHALTDLPVAGHRAGRAHTNAHGIGVRGRGPASNEQDHERA